MFSNTLTRRRCVPLWFVAMVIGLSSIAAAVPPARIWVDATGRHSVKARLVEIIDNETVVLLREDGRQVHLFLESLSRNDQRYVEDYQDVDSRPSVLQPSVLQPAAVEVLIPETLDLPAAEATAAENSVLPFATESTALVDLPLNHASLHADPSPWVLGAVEARIPIPEVDTYTRCSRAIPIVAETQQGSRIFLGMSVSTGNRLNLRGSRNQLLRFDVDQREAEVVMSQLSSIELLDHHVDSGRSLILSGFDSLGNGGAIAVASGWGGERIKIKHRRLLDHGDETSLPPKLRWARWVDEEHFVALIDETLGLWNILSGQRVYSIDAIDRRATLAISGGRRYMAIPTKDGVDIVSTVDGKKRASIQTESQVPSVAFSRHGDTLAIATKRKMLYWDLSQTVVVAEVPGRHASGSRSPVWIDNDLLITATGILCSRQRQSMLWQYDVTACEVERIGRHLAIFRRLPETELTIVRLPHPQAAEAIQFADQRRESTQDASRVLGQSEWLEGGWDTDHVQITLRPPANR